MLFSSIQEINAIYPTSRWDDISSLLNPLQKVERTKLVKYLGTPLLRKLNEQYRLFSEQEGGITADIIDDTQTSFTLYAADGTANTLPMLSIDILRACQEIILYIFLSNNNRTLSSSLNRGGGFNAMTADDYDQSSDKQLSALKAEHWHSAMDSVENLLLLLEEDAKDGQVYTDLWKQSHYYYHHSDLLFTTAEDLNHYLDINESRDQYVSLVPVIRNCQDNYLAGRIGTELLSAVVNGTLTLSSNTLLDDDSSSPSSNQLLDSLTHHLKLALANYVSASHEYITLRNYKDTAIKQATLAAQEAHGNGDMQVALASRLVVTNSEAFSSYIENSTTLQSIYKTETGKEWGAPSIDQSIEDNTCPLSHRSGMDDRHYSAIADFGGLHLN